MTDWGLWTNMMDVPSHPLPLDHRENSQATVSLDTIPVDRGKIWAHMVPIERANKRQTGAMTQGDPL